MCGILATVGPHAGIVLRELLLRAAERGPHGWGLYDGIAGRRVGLGRYTERSWTPPDIDGPVIGHTRLATSAGADVLEALQPLIFAGFALAHNGTVPEAGDWQQAWRCPWVTGNDSELLGRFLERRQDPWPTRLRALDARLTRPYAIAVWTPDAVWVQRRGHPLYATARAVCSRPLPGGVPIVAGVPVRLDARAGADVRFG